MEDKKQRVLGGVHMYMSTEKKYSYNSVIGFWISRIKLLLNLKSPFASGRSMFRTIFWNAILSYFCIATSSIERFGIWYGLSYVFLANAVHSAFCWYVNMDDYSERIRYKALFLMQFLGFLYLGHITSNM